MTRRVNYDYFTLPLWNQPGRVYLFLEADHLDVTRIRLRTRPALITCHTCRRPLKIGQRTFLHRHLYHFWSHYTPLWKRQEPAPQHQAKEQHMEVLTGVFVGLIAALVVIYLGWLYWKAISGVIE
jgi:hypothetical protein